MDNYTLPPDVEIAKTLRNAESLAKAAGVELNLSKQTFVIKRDSLIKLILGIHNNEYKRGMNDQLCLGCKSKMQNHATRPYGTPSKVWDFCAGCPHKKIIKK